MSRWRNPLSPLDDVQASDGDTAWIGVNAKLSRDKLAPGYAPAATNKLFVSGDAQTRGGTWTPVSHRSGAALLYGSGIYSDPDGVEWIAQAHAAGITFTRDGCSPFTITIPEVLAATVEFVQAFNELVVFRGEAAVQWVWEGELSGEFAFVSQISAGDGTVPMPKAVTAELYANRFFIPSGRDRITVSDLLDFTRCDSLLNEFNVNSGSDDALVRVFPFTNNSILVFKDQSTHVISNVYGDLTEVRLDQINGSIGCIARKSVAMVGGDVFFLSSNGVFRVQQILQDRLQTGAVPVSDPISPLLTRINSRFQHLCVAAVLGRYFYLAVPLDSATRPNALLVYDTVSDAWQGIHTWPTGVHFDNLLVTDWGGNKRLYGIDHTTAKVFVLYEGLTDRIGDTENQISDSLETRGYLLGDNGIKNFRRVGVNITTWNPSLTIAVLLDGQNEVKTLTSTPITKSPLAYYTHGTADWDASNVNDDHANPKREDYSIDPATAGVSLLDESGAPILAEDGTSLIVGYGVDPNTSGIDPDRKQTCLERRPCSVRARWASIRITNTQGVCDISSVDVEAATAGRAVATHA